MLVFSQFVAMLGLIRTTLAERGWPIYYLAGDTENRGELVREFQSALGAAIFLISLKAGGFGLNLTAASYVVLFDPWWNPAVENQAIDRTHRIGQVNKVIAYRLLVKDSVEGKIRALQKTKRRWRTMSSARSSSPKASRWMSCGRCLRIENAETQRRGGRREVHEKHEKARKLPEGRSPANHTLSHHSPNSWAQRRNHEINEPNERG